MTPVVPSIVASDVLLLVQVPPGVASANVVVLPTQTEAVPVIGDSALTVMTVDTMQFAGVV